MIHILSRVCLAVILGIAVFQDVWARKIKNEVSVAGVILGLLFSTIHPDSTFLFGLLGFLVSFAVGLVCWNLKLFRAGDAKLLCAVGAFLGWEMSLSCLLLAIIFGAIIGLPFVIHRLIKKQKGLTKIPFSLAIALACAVTVQFGCLWEFINIL